ncbi:hypothetical protein [Aequorivita sp. Q41]|uniref:hypothetical protein n=1 Tax=Aequorivita sp. Q41 TaxID=3153300 RepID=UPI003242F5A2
MLPKKFKQALTSNDELTASIKTFNIHFFDELIDVIRNLPYGRNSNRDELTLVLKEQKGSCSSKHALVKQIADLNSIPNVKLILGIYKMDAINTPKIGSVLAKTNLAYIPEAHCYLNIDGMFLDITTAKSNFKNIAHDILETIEILPEQVSKFKVTYHKSFLKSWLAKENNGLRFDEVWRLREKCITSLSQ